MDEMPVSKPDPKPATPIQRSRWRKWARRFLFGVTALIVLSVVALFGARVYFRHTGERDLKAEVARLDAEDPGWRWEDLEAARQKAVPPEAENSAKVVREVRSMIPKEWDEWVKRPDQPKDAEPPPLNRHIPLADLTRDEELAAATRPARDRGLALRNYPRGYHVVVVTDFPFLESLKETQEAREVANLLKTDAILAAQKGDAVRGLRDAHAILNDGRSVGDEPSLISSLVRFALGCVAVETAMRVLALTESKAAEPELAALQAALVAETGEPILLNGLRGERAITSRFFDGLNSGRISADHLARMAEGKPSAEHRVVVYFLNAFVPEDQRRYLRLMSELTHAVKRPYVEQAETLVRLESDLRVNRDIRYRWNALMLPAAVKVMDANVRHRAELLSAAALIACERFRLARGRWPESLAELPKDLLPAIPTDPFTGQPMKFARLPDGIAVYSTPPKDMFERDKKRLTNPLGGTEIGWRLYDPAQRGLPPRPELAPAPHEVEPAP
jgi:hypothetical protein